MARFFCTVLLVFSFFAPEPVVLWGEHLLPETGILHPLSAPEKGDIPRSALLPEQSHKGIQTYTLEPPAHDLITYYFRKHTTEEGRAYLGTVLRRAQPYKDFIISRIEYYDMPRELLFLPIVESAYYIKAVSRSGAAGLWQFMLNSISPYGMSVNEWVDERRDFWKSTEASLQKLAYNYSYLGDWYLALAAYNCGLGKVRRTIEKTGIRDYWELIEGGYLPSETAHYIPKFLAIAGICSYPGRYGLEPEWDTSYKWVRIPLERALDIRLLASAAAIPLDILKAGNAELNYPVTPPGDSNYFLKVPDVYSDAVKEVLSTDENRLMRFYVYTIRSGDTLYELSRHYRVSVDMIERYNQGIQPKALRIGQRVLIPTIHDVSPYPGKTRTGNQGLRLKEISFTGKYTVKKGDTLWAIARRYRISPEDLADANMMRLDTTIHEGLLLKVPEE